MRSLWKAGVAALLGLLLVSCGDTYRPIVNPITRPSGDPGSFDVVVSMNQNPTGNAPGTFSEINVSGDVLTAVRNIGREPVAMSFDSTRVSVFFANQNSDSVTVGALTSEAVVTINLLAGSHPTGITGLSTGRIYVANTGATAAFDTIAACPNGSVGFLNSANAVLMTNVCLPSPPVFLLEVPSAQKLYAISQDSKVRVINTGNASLTGATLTVGSNPVAAVPSLDGTLLYVLNEGSGTISVINIATDTVTSAGISTNGSNPISFTLDRRLNRLYVANTGSNNVAVFDASVNPPTLLRTVAAGAAPNRVAVPKTGEFVYVSNSGSNVITEISSTGFQTSEIRVRPVGMDPATADANLKLTSVATSNDGSKVYGSFVEPTDQNNGVAVLRSSTHSLILTLPAPLQDVSTCDPAVTGSNCTNMRQRPVDLRAR